MPSFGMDNNRLPVDNENTNDESSNLSGVVDHGWTGGAVNGNSFNDLLSDRQVLIHDDSDGGHLHHLHLSSDCGCKTAEPSDDYPGNAGVFDSPDSDYDEPMDWHTFERPLSPPVLIPPASPSNQPSVKKVHHPCPPADFGAGANLLQTMEEDQYEAFRKDNIFYPFASRAEWELASWLSQGALSQKAIDMFLRLEYVGTILYSVS